MSTDEDWPCDCNQLRRIALSDVWPLDYDDKTNTFRLFQRAGKGPEGGFLRIRCCPWCGEQLESTDRLELAEEITGEIERLRQRLESAQTIEDVEDILGEATRRIQIDTETQEESTSHRQFVFEEGLVDVWVTVTNDGEPSASFVPADQD